MQSIRILATSPVFYTLPLRMAPVTDPRQLWSQWREWNNWLGDAVIAEVFRLPQVTKLTKLGSEVLTARSMKMTVFWVLAQYNLVEV
jgi:hypothetical protein